MEQTNYTIQELLEICSDFVQNGADAEKMERVEEMKKNFVIRTYIPSDEKTFILRSILAHLKEQELIPQHMAIRAHMVLVFEGLLSYVVNIDKTGVTAYEEPILLDMLYLSGVADYIIDYVGKDWVLLNDLFKDTISFENVAALLKETEMASPEAVENLAKQISWFKGDEAKEVLAKLGDLLSYNDPSMKLFKETAEELGEELITKQ